MLTKAQKTARKAVRTRQARQAFEDAYGTTTFMVVRGVLQGQDEVDLMWEVGIEEEQLRAYKANISRGTYDSMLTYCNF